MILFYLIIAFLSEIIDAIRFSGNSKSSSIDPCQAFCTTHLL